MKFSLDKKKEETMNRVDKWVLLNLVIPSIVAGLVSYQVVKHYDFIHRVISDIFN